MTINIEMLRCFVAVVQSGNLETAALQLNRTPSAVSMMLKQFEQHVGLALFISNRKNKLTKSGENIYKVALRELEHFEKTVGEIQNIVNAKAGSIKIAVTPSIANALLPSIIKSFIAQHPKTKIEVRDMTSSQVGEAIHQQKADVGIACYQEISHLHMSRLFSDRFGYICRKDDQDIKRWHTMTWADMQDKYFILNDLCEYIDDVNFIKLSAQAQLSAPNIASLLGMIRAGIGVSILPELAANMLEPDLCFLPLTNTQAKREIYLISQPIRTLTPVAQAFVHAVEQYDYKTILFQNN